MDTGYDTPTIGKFRINWERIQQDPESVLKLMAHMIVVKAETLYHLRCIEYTAYSDFFDPLLEGHRLRLYEFTYNGIAWHCSYS